MATTDSTVKNDFSNYSDSILKVLQDILDILNFSKIVLTFDSKGGSFVNSITVYRGQSFGNLPIPEKPGYAFDGWFTTYKYNPVSGKETYSNEIEDYTTVQLSSSITLYAKWVYASYRIDLNPMGGAVNPPYLSVQYESQFGPLPVPTRPNSVFSYWEDSTGREIKSTTILDFYGGELSAVYDGMSFPLSFDYDYHKYMEISGDWDEETYPLSLMVFSDERFGLGNYVQHAKKTLSSTGYFFVGWSESKDNPNVMNYVNVWDDTTLYAYWEPIRYDVKYLLHGSVLSVQEQTFGQVETLIPVSELMDKTLCNRFEHWNCENAVWHPGKNYYDDGEAVCNLMSSMTQGKGFVEISAVLSGNSTDPQALSLSYVLMNGNTDYVVGDDICMSDFKVNVIFENNNRYNLRTPLSVYPHFVEREYQTVTLYWGNSFSDMKSIQYNFKARKKEKITNIQLLSAGMDTSYHMGEYPDLNSVELKVTTNYGNVYNTTDFMYEPTSALYTSGYFDISATTHDMTEILSDYVWKIPFSVSPVVDHLEIISASTLSNFTQGDELSTNGLVVSAFYINDTSEQLELLPDMFTPLSGSQLSVGMTSVRIAVDNDWRRGVSYPINVSADMGELSITHLPKKMQYEVGETFDSDGLSAKMVYKHHAPFDVKTDNLLTYNIEFWNAGAQSVPIFYDTASMQLSVMVLYPYLINKFFIKGMNNSIVLFDNVRPVFGGGIMVDYGSRKSPELIDGKIDYHNFLSGVSFGTSDNGPENRRLSSETTITFYSEYDENDSLRFLNQISGNNSFAGYVENLYGNIPEYFLYQSNRKTQQPLNIVVGEKPYTYSIGQYAFCSCDNISHISLDSTKIESIGDYAFMDCNYKDSQDILKFPLTLKRIGIGTFFISNTSLYGKNGCKTIDFSDSLSSLEEIGDYSFYNNINLETINFETQYEPIIDSLGDYTFYNCSSLTAINGCPSSLLEIGDYVFYNCNKLQRISLANNIQTIGYHVFDGCSSLVNIDIDYENSKLSSINDYAFQNCNLNNLNLPNATKEIGINSFAYNSNLTDVFIPRNVSSIGLYAFGGCSKNLVIRFEATSSDVLYTNGIELENLGDWNNLSVTNHILFERTRF